MRRRRQGQVAFAGAEAVPRHSRRIAVSGAVRGDYSPAARFRLAITTFALISRFASTLADAAAADDFAIHLLFPPRESISRAIFLCCRGSSRMPRR